jgi:hypothetical protein
VWASSPDFPLTLADNAEQGVVAYNGKLDIRPPY